MNKRLLALLLSACLVLPLMPTVAFASGEGAIMLGTGGVSSGDTVYFGKYAEGGKTYEVPWVVLDSGVIATPDSGAVPMLSQHILGKADFRNEFGYYNGSWLQMVNEDLNFAYSIYSGFSKEERGAVKATTLTGASMYSSEKDITAHLFPLSKSEAEGIGSGSELLKAKFITAPTGEIGRWWLRSSGNLSNAFLIDANGQVDLIQYSSLGVRPAFNLDSESVLFTSAAKDGKFFPYLGNMYEIPNTATSEWKLTLKDSGRSNFDITAKTVTASRVTISYEGALTGAKEYISAMVVDGSGRMLCYGRIKSLSTPGDASGSVTVDIPTKVTFGSGAKLKVFNEQFNGDYKTDYASELKDVPLPASSSGITITPTALNLGKAAEGYPVPSPQQVAIKNTGNSSVKLIQPTASSFNISQLSKTELSANETATFTVQPKSGLKIGDYNEAITINTENNILECINVKFTVTTKSAVSGIPTGNTIYFGKYTEGGKTYDVPWVVLDDGIISAPDSGEGLPLLSQYILGQSQFRPDLGYYGGSTLQKAMDDLNNPNSIFSQFSAGERGAVKSTTLAGSSMHSSQNAVAAHLFTLSNDEMKNTDFNTNLKRAYNIPAPDGSTGDWWLRSSFDNNYPFYVDGAGNPARSYSVNTRSSLGVRPAFNLDSTLVLFASAATGGKSSGTEGAGALEAISTAPNASWKLTMKDSARSSFAITAKQANSGSVSVSYVGALTGPNEYISAMIMDDSGKPLYYGRIKSLPSPEAASGSVNIDIPSAVAFASNATLKVFNEQYNGNYKTDYASELIEVPIPAPSNAIIVTPTELDFGSEAEGYSLPDAQQVTIKNTGNSSLKLTQPTASSFNISPLSKTDILVKETTTFTVQPKNGLPAGVYDETIIISTDDSNTKVSVNVKFTVDAAFAGNSITLGTGSISAGNTIYFGKYTESATPYDVPWVVLKDKAISAPNSGAGLHLLSRYLLGDSEYHWGYCFYNTSAVRIKMDSMNNDNSIYSQFSACERGAVKATDLAGDDMGGTGVPGAYLFPPAVSETKSIGSGLMKAKYISAPNDVAGRWWLRSSSNISNPYTVDASGSVGLCNLNDYENISLGVRPALNLDPAAVLSTSAANDGKSFGTLGTMLEIPNITTSEWKLMLKDSARSSFAITTNKVNSGSVTFSYEGALTGANEYISAMLVDDSGKALCYGRIKNLAALKDDSGSVTVSIPATVAFEPGTVLRVFNEQYNGDYKTDYSSEFKDVPLPPPSSGISITPTELDFGNAVEGYPFAPTAQEVTIKNIGSSSLRLIQPTASSFNISLLGKTEILAGEKTTFSVQPKSGLQAGVYSETIIISADDNTKTSINIRFKVVYAASMIPAGHKVYFGKYTESGKTYDVPWVVLDDGIIPTPDSGAGFPLLSQYLLGKSVFQPSGSGYYIGSPLERTMSDFNNQHLTTSLFSAGEHGAVKTTTLESDSMYPTQGDLTAYLFALSRNEVPSSDSGIELMKAKYITAPNESPSRWWLRTSSTDTKANGVDEYGLAISALSSSIYGVRPAFNLDAASVLFASAAEGGKSSVIAGNGFKPIFSTDTKAWKLTMKDAGRNVTVGTVTRSGNEVTILWSGATTGERSYVSALIMDSSCNIKYYTKLGDSSASAAGSAVVSLPDGFDANNWTLKVFSEQCNGDFKTDYAGALIVVPLKAPSVPTVTPTELDFGSVTEGYSVPAAQKVSIQNIDNCTVTLGNNSHLYFSAPQDITYGDEVTFFIQPKSGLKAGVYIETYTVSINGKDIGVKLKFTVKAKPVDPPSPADPPASDNRIVGIISGQSFSKGSTVTFTVSGGGMDNTKPNTGDKRWLPTAWSTNPSGDFSIGFTQSFSTAGMSLGAHILTVRYTKQQYNGSKWADVIPSVTDTKSISYSITGGESGNESGDRSFFEEYQISATTEKGGSISPSGAVSVTEHSSRTFAITPDKNYVIKDVLVDGVSVGVVTKYTFQNVIKDHTIKAVFRIKNANSNPNTGMDNPYSGIALVDWIYKAVMTVYQNLLNVWYLKDYFLI